MARKGEVWEAFGRLSDDEFAAALDQVTLRMRNLLYAKRQAYGPTNLVKFGDYGVLVRTSDKLECLAHMQREGLDVTAVGESARDAWRDIAGYALLVLAAYVVQPTDAVVHEGLSIHPEKGLPIHPERK